MTLLTVFAQSGGSGGYSSLTFASSGTLTGAAASDIAGSSSLTFASSGALAADVQVAGSSNITFTTAGDLTGSGAAGAIAGSTSLTFTPSGALAVRVNIFGTTALVFTGTATADQPTPPEPPFIRPSRSGGGSMYVLPSETAADKLRLREDQEMVEIVSILATMGVFHGNR
jgi:hypothetical protein